MTDYRALCVDLLWALENAISIIYRENGTKHISTVEPIVANARAALAQPEPLANEEVARMVAWLRQQDGGIARRAAYSRAADLLERLTQQPVPEEPSDEDIMELMPQQMRDDLAAAARAMAGFGGPTAAMGAIRIILNRHAVDHARAVLARWGRP